MVKIRKKQCKVCKDKFQPWNTLTRVCSPKCALTDGREQQAKKDRKELKQGRERLKTRSDHLKEAQTAFNRYIRARDACRPCVSCDKPDNGQHQRHASHYRSVGACPELRFNELNVHASCATCNSTLSGNLIEYRIRLKSRITAEKVEWLEGPHKPKKYTVEEIKAIKAKYSALAREFSV